MCGSDNPGYLDPSHRNMKPRLYVMRLIAPLPCFISARVVFLGTFLEDSTLYSLGDMESTICIVVLRARYGVLEALEHLQRSTKPV